MLAVAAECSSDAIGNTSPWSSQGRAPEPLLPMDDAEEQRKRLRAAETSLGWLAGSTVGTKRQRVIEGVSTASLVDLQAEVYRQQEHARLIAEGVLPAELRDRRKAGTVVSQTFDRQNAGVAERQARDQLHVKTADDKLAESRAALERKARLYDDLRAGRADDDAAAYNVDFLQRGFLGEEAAPGRAERPLYAVYEERQARSGPAAASEGMVSADMLREQQRQRWEEEAEDDERQWQQRQEERQRNIEGIQRVKQETAAAREKATDDKRAKAEAEAQKRAQLKAAFLKKRLQQAKAGRGAAQPDKGPAALLPGNIEAQQQVHSMQQCLLNSQQFLSGRSLRQQAAKPKACSRTAAVRTYAGTVQPVPGAGDDRQLWLPGTKPPAHLKGEQAGDFGFDPLNLGADPQALRWYTHAEIFHGRLAMAAVAGILIPGLLTGAGALNVPQWYDAGKVSIENSSIPFSTLLIIEFFSFGFVEVKRWMDFRKPQSQAEPNSFAGFEGLFKGTGENAYPGGIFDPLGFSRGSEKSYNEYKLKELKNGRLAMLAFLGFNAQYLATGKGPLENLADHIANPAEINFTTNGVSLPFPFMQP